MSDRYRVGFDAGNGDEACFTLLRWLCDEWHIEVRAYGTTAQRLNAAFQAEADLTAALYAANERARVAEEALMNACIDSYGMYMEGRVDSPQALYGLYLTAARTALRSEGSDTASE